MQNHIHSKMLRNIPTFERMSFALQVWLYSVYTWLWLDLYRWLLLWLWYLTVIPYGEARKSINRYQINILMILIVIFNSNWTLNRFGWLVFVSLHSDTKRNFLKVKIVFSEFFRVFRKERLFIFCSSKLVHNFKIVKTSI